MVVLSYSATGTRTRVARVRAEYPNQLDYSGSCGFQFQATSPCDGNVPEVEDARVGFGVIASRSLVEGLLTHGQDCSASGHSSECPRPRASVALRVLERAQCVSTSNSRTRCTPVACATRISGACSVAASYKPPMLVTRVRLPACAANSAL